MAVRRKKEHASEIIKKHISSKQFSNVYLFYGEETFLKELYIPKLKKLVYDGSFPDFNDIRITAETPPGDIDAAFESYPVMSEKKYIYVKDSGIFAKSCSAEKTDFWLEKLSDTPDFLFILFDEKDVSAASKTYKALQKHGTALNFEYWEQSETLAWVQRYCRSSGKKIDKYDAEYFIGITNPGLSSLKNELDKLICYCRTEILRSDIDRLVSKSLDTQIFDVTDYIIKGNLSMAMKVLYDFKAQNMKPIDIFFLIFGSFSRMLRTLLILDDGGTYETAASAVYPNNRPSSMVFLIKNLEKRAKILGENFLTKQVISASEIMLKVRSGNMNEWLALEEYVAECIYSRANKQYR